MEFGSVNGGDDGEHSGVGFVDISKIFVMQVSIFFRRISLIEYKIFKHEPVWLCKSQE